MTLPLLTRGQIALLPSLKYNILLSAEPGLGVCSLLQQEAGAQTGEVRGTLLWGGGGWENHRCGHSYNYIQGYMRLNSGLSDLVRVSIGWQLGDVYHEQIGLCHDEKIFSTIWTNYTLQGASIDFRLTFDFWTFRWMVCVWAERGNQTKLYFDY